MKHRRIWFVMLGIIAIGVLVTTCNSFILNREATSSSAAHEFALDEAEVPADLDEGQKPEAGAAMAKAADESDLTSATAATAKQFLDGTAKTTAAAGTETAKSQSEEVAAEILSPLETTAAITFIESGLAEPGGSAGRDSASLVGDESKSSYRIRLDELNLQIQKIRSTETEATTYSMKTAAENELKLWDSELNNIYNDLLTHLNEEETKELVTAERDWMKVRDAKAVEAARKSAGGTLEGLEYTASLAESTRQRAYELADMYELVAE